MTDTFLPEKYEVSGGSANYMRFEAGSNKFRILSKPLIGWEWWVTKDGAVRGRNERPEKGDKPVRVGRDGKIPADATEVVKEFWAMPVWNYKTGKIQVLELTQKGILRTITTFARDAEWGSPLGYDLQVIKTGEKLDTSYEVIPSPHRAMPKEVTDQFDKMEIKIEALLEGKNPFGEDKGSTESVASEEEVNELV